jgi:hypothetical protein
MSTQLHDDEKITHVVDCVTDIDDYPAVEKCETNDSNDLKTDQKIVLVTGGAGKNCPSDKLILLTKRIMNHSLFPTSLDMCLHYATSFAIRVLQFLLLVYRILCHQYHDTEVFFLIKKTCLLRFLRNL